MVNLFCRKIRAESHTHFWKAKCFGDFMRKDVFLLLYKLEVDKNCMVLKRLKGDTKVVFRGAVEETTKDEQGDRGARLFERCCGRSCFV